MCEGSIPLAHAAHHTAKGTDVGVDERVDPDLILGLLALALNAGGTKKKRFHVAVDGLVLSGVGDEALMVDANVVVLLLDTIVPVPALAVNGVMGELVEALDVAKVVDVEQGVVARAVGAEPVGDVVEAVLGGALSEVLVHLSEVLTNFATAGAEEAHGVVEADTEVEDDEGLGGGNGWDGAGGGIGELSAGATADDALHEGVGLLGASIEDGRDDGAETHGQSRNDSVLGRKDGEEGALHQCAD